MTTLMLLSRQKRSRQKSPRRNRTLRTEALCKRELLASDLLASHYLPLSGDDVPVITAPADPAAETDVAQTDEVQVQETAVTSQPALAVDGIVFDNQEFSGLFSAPTAPGVGSILREDYDSTNDEDITLDQIQLIGQAGSVGDEIRIRFLDSSLSSVGSFDYAFTTTSPSQHTVTVLPTITIPDAGVIEIEVLSGTFNWWYNANSPSTGSEVLASYGPSSSHSYKMSLQNTLSGGPSGTPDLTTARLTTWDSELVISTTTGTNATAAVIEASDTLYADVAFMNVDRGDGGAAIVDAFDYEIRIINTDNTTTLLADGTHSAPMAVGSFIYIEDIALGSLSAGIYTLEFVVDTGDDITESVETNNYVRRTIGVDQYNNTSQSISGISFQDDDGDGIRDAGEPVRSGTTIYADLDDDGILDAGEPSAVSGVDGTYTLTGMYPGNHVIRQVTTSDEVATLPGADGGIDADFEIDLLFRSDDISASQESVIQSAADRWAEVIRGELSDQLSAGLYIDDIAMEINTEAIDGAFGTLGHGSATDSRPESEGSLPYRGEVSIDSDDIDRLETNGTLYDLALHEIGHALGYGTLWDGMTTGFGTTDPRFTGPNAVAQYQAIFDTTETGVPLYEVGADGDGSYGSHWRESTFGAELMTPTLSSVSNPLSLITIASFADIGYTVHLGAADDYTSPSGDPFIAPPSDPAPVSQPADAYTHVVSVGSGEAVSDVDFAAKPLTIFTVNSTDDLGDADLGDGVAEDINGNTTLRAAIEQANASAESFPEHIRFGFSGSSTNLISLSSALPAITSPIVIDGTTLSGYAGTPLIQIDGGSTIADGLLVTTTGSTISGVSMTGFTDSGIELNGGGSNTVSQNFLGINSAGTADPNYYGLRIKNSTGNTVDDNVISGNNRAGVLISGAAASQNRFTNNFVGTNAAGDAAIPNATDGFTILAPNNQIGVAGQGNVISGNSRWGVFTKLAGRGSNVVQGNIIGLNAAGTAAVPNAIGVTLQSDSNQIGGSGTGEGNVISGNIAYGVAITMLNANDNIIQGNMIGTDAAGTTDLGNGLYGVRITQGARNEIGGAGAGEGNVISGNNHSGVLLVYWQSTGNQIVGNKIGTDLDGTTALGNSKEGVRFVLGATANTVQSNVISGNGGRGVVVDGTTTSANEILSNKIGTDANGTSPLHNGAGGAVRILSPDTVVTGNTISSVDTGVLAFRSTATGTVISQNYVGIDPAGSSSTLGMTTGIAIASGAANSTVSQNVIANNQNGIVLTSSGNGNRITQNSLHSLSIIGIDLNADGRSTNDIGDSDSGENNLQNTPTIASATLSGSSLSILYDVDSLVSNAAYPLTIEFFVDDGSGNGETYLGLDSLAGPSSKSVTLTGISGLNLGDSVLATATDANGNTSEFSLGVTVV